MNNTYPIRPERGFSIVELMIALLLGLILLGGVIQVFLSSRQTYSANEAMSRMQENGRFALEFIARSARLSGYMDPTLTTGKPLPLVSDDDTSVNEFLKSCNSNRSTPQNDCMDHGNPPKPISGDRVAFMFQPPLDPATDKRYDCAGKSLPIGNDEQLIINAYYVVDSQLKCRTISQTPPNTWPNGSGETQVLVEGIDALQVLYGVDNGGDSRSSNQYVSADRVSNWNKVRSIRIAVLANSMQPLNPAPAARQYALLDASPLNAAALNAAVPDNANRARQIFTTTIQLKNFE